MPSIAANQVLISSTGELAGTWGSTGVAASRKLHGVEEFNATVTEAVETPRAVGWFGPGPVGNEVSQGAEFNMSGTWTYQEAVKILNGIFTASTASTCASTGFIDWHWFAPLYSTQICFTYPIEFGASTGNAYKINGGVLSELTLSGEAGGLWKFETAGFGRNILALTTGMSTSAIADVRAVNAVAMKDTQLRINPMTTGTWGSSSGLVDATLISFELSVDTKRHAKLFAGGRNPGGWGDGVFEGTLKTVLEFNASAKAYVDSLLGQNATGSTGAQLERIITLWATRDSSALVSAFNFAGIVSEPVKLWDDRDGNMTVELTWAGKFTTGLQDIGTSGVGNWLSFQICQDSSKSS